MEITFYNPSTITTALIAVVLVLCHGLYMAALPKPLPGIPYRHDGARSILGDGPAVMKHAKSSSDTPVEWMAAQFIELDSPIYQMFLPFKPPQVFISDHREGLDIMLRRAKDFDHSKSFADAFRGTLPNSHLTMATKDPRFKPQRRLVADIMTSSFLTNVAARHVYKQSLLLVDLWRAKSRLVPGHPFEATDDINHTALDAIWAVAFGTDIGTVQAQCQALEKNLPEAYEAITVLAHDLEAAAHTLFPRLAHWLRRQTRRWKRAKISKDRLLQDRLDDAKARFLNTESREDMVDCATDHMVFREHQAAIKEGRTPQYDTPGAKDELLTFLLAGHETTSTAIRWAVKFLADHPEVQSKLRSTLRTVYPDEQLPSGAEIARANIPYFDATIEEVLRLGLTIPGQTRIALHDTEVLGYAIPKGVEVSFMCNGPGFVRPDPFAAKDKAVPEWDQATIGAFEPDRWLKRNEAGKTVFDANAGPTSQFGAGVRGCFGRKLAYLELRIMFTVLIWHFEFPELDDSLSSYNAALASTRIPVKCYVAPIELPIQKDRVL
ncbi:hypothetical protein ANO11243_091160 [Dothideomycetidae sp. 11243]|nr:hypothetical protein ANO11243_091160 [fungal sp. No.11243]